MIAVITGDIVNSREGSIENWLTPLKEVLNYYGSSPKQWEIFRGDSFQLSLPPKEALIAAFHIKATIKQTDLYDVRMGIGIGIERFSAQKISESNGEAYIHSGEAFDSLNKQQYLSIKTNTIDLTNQLNIMLNLALLTANTWGSVTAQVIKTAIENPNTNQTKLAKLRSKSQSSISEALKRGGFDEIMAIHHFYTKQIF